MSLSCQPPAMSVKMMRCCLPAASSAHCAQWISAQAIGCKPPPPHAFLIRGLLHDETFEVGLDDLQYVQTVSPLRIEHIVVSRCSRVNELVLKVLNTKQRVMVTEDIVFYVTSRKRKVGQLSK